MTFCLTMKVRDGLVGIADTRITTGSESITARKLSVYEHPEGRYAMWIMTSGLRSVRDKCITYFEEDAADHPHQYNKLYKAVNGFAGQLRRVAEEDQNALAQSGLSFNLFALIGGQLQEDEEHKCYLLYPQGNWVEVGAGSPYFIIGNSGYGKPTLERVLRYDSSMEYALKAGFLAFDATRVSATDVGYPIDVSLYRRDSHRIIVRRFEREELDPLGGWWQEKVQAALGELPDDWVQEAFRSCP